MLRLLGLCALATAAFGSIISVDKETNRFVDPLKRERFFHGVNAVYKLPPYHPDPYTLDGQYSLTGEDADQLRAWGFNIVRLGVMWAGLEPEMGVYNTTYLDNIAAIVDTLSVRGIYTILDMHQDVLARDFCGNGIPSWAAQMAANESFKFPLPAHFPFEVDSDGHPGLDDCLSNDFVTYYFSGAVSKAFQSLYTNRLGLLDMFSKFWTTVAERFKGQEYVFGYEIINEPWAGDIYSDPRRIFNAETSLLKPFYKTVHSAIREVDDDHIVLYEPLTYDMWPVNFDGNPLVEDGDEYNDRTAMSYHIYCPLAGGDHTPLALKLACQAIDLDFFHQRQGDISRIGGGGIMTEWGSLADTPLDLQELGHVMRLADDYLASHIYWQYKDYHDITSTGEAGEISLMPGGAVAEDKVHVLTRPYAQAVAGHVKKMKFYEVPEKLKIQYEPNESETFVDAQSRTTVVVINRVPGTGYFLEAGIKATVEWGGREGGRVYCGDEGRRVYIEHPLLSGEEEVNSEITIEITACNNDDCLC